MGTARSKMNPLFIDNIETFAGKNKNYPSPISYRAASTITDGVKYSMRPKQIRYGEKDENFSQNYLDRQKKLPGPGYYEHAQTVGLNNVSSRYENNRQTQFSKATDRWAAGAQLKKPPGPGNYDPKASITHNVSSTMPKNSLTKFGQDNKSVYHIADKNNKFIPGPGAYARFSEFDN